MNHWSSLRRLDPFYRWEGTVRRDSEVLMIAKTRHPFLERLVARLQASHSYDAPEVTTLPIVGGSGSYLRWLVDVTSSG